MFRVLRSFWDQDQSGRQLSSSLEAIRNAIEPGVSRYQDGNGLGFPSLLHALADLWRTARIRSGEAGLLIDRTEDQRKNQICLPAATSWGSYLNTLCPRPAFQASDLGLAIFSLTHPCHWLHEDESLPVATRLTIFQRGDKANVAVMHESKAVAEFRGEAARDLKEMFRKHANLQNMLPVVVVRVSEASEPRAGKALALLLVIAPIHGV